MFEEIELKLYIEPEDANLLHDHPIIIEHAHGDSELHYLISTYYDTPNLDLRKNGYALRIRQCDHRFFQTVKSNGKKVGDLHHRHEWECEVEEACPNLALLEPTIQERLQNSIDKQTLRPIFVSEFQRTTWLLAFADGTQVEIALDFGEVRVNDSNEQISEIELELKAGDSAKLYEIADVLSKSIPLRVEDRSKAARGYQLYLRQTQQNHS